MNSNSKEKQRAMCDFAAWQEKEKQIRELNSAKIPRPKRELRIGEPCVVMRYNATGRLLYTNIMYYRGVADGRRVFGFLPIGNYRFIKDTDVVVPYSDYSPYNINSNKDKGI